MAKHAGAYRSEKRKKEISRQKKQEEKRQRRLKKDADPQHITEITVSEDTEKEMGQESAPMDN